MKQFLAVLLTVFLSISTAFALDLHVAKTQGLVGERVDGFLGFVVTPPAADVAALVKDVNNKRKVHFAETARKNNISVEKVSVRFYQLAVEATEVGHYYQNARGEWVQK